MKVAWAFLVISAGCCWTGCARPTSDPATRQNGRQEVRPPLRPGSRGRSVISDYGPLRVRAGAIEEGEVPESKRPWSAYYYPLKDTALFGDGQGNLAKDSPLAKYDQYSVRRTPAVPKQAAAWERDTWQKGGREAQGWEGLCNAWAFASLLSPAPLASRTVMGITFSVGDQKALLLKTYESTEALVHYGRNFEAGPDADWNVVYPEEFHRFLQVQLFEKKQPFIMDADATGQIWNYPVHYARTEVTADPHDPGRVHVRAQVLASGMLERRYRDSIEVPAHPFEYTYDLVGNPRSDGTLDVVYGEWKGDSYSKMHPNYLIPMPQELQRASANPEIDTGLVDEILGNPG